VPYTDPELAGGVCTSFTSASKHGLELQCYFFTQKVCNYVQTEIDAFYNRQNGNCAIDHIVLNWGRNLALLSTETTLTFNPSVSTWGYPG